MSKHNYSSGRIRRSDDASKSKKSGENNGGPPQQQQQRYPGGVPPQTEQRYPGGVPPQTEQRYPGGVPPQTEQRYPGGVPPQTEQRYPGGVTPQGRQRYPSGDEPSVEHRPYNGQDANENLPKDSKHRKAGGRSLSARSKQGRAPKRNAVKDTPSPQQEAAVYRKENGRQEINGDSPAVFSELERDETPAAAPPRAPRKPKKKKRRGIKTVAALLVLLLAVGFVLGFAYLSSILDTGLLGTVSNGDSLAKDYSKWQTANILIVGIDNEEGRDYGAGRGNTDMILYANYNLKENELNLLQIPRDSYVGEEGTGGSGKINALLMNGGDAENPINNLSNVVEKQFKLPVDYYVALDMDGMRAIVDALGGIEVYVPQEMSFAGSYLPQGLQLLDGNAAEFFVRNRSGPGFEQADISRLDNQRYFYSALFRRMLNMGPREMVRMMPVFKTYCSTDIEAGDVLRLGMSAIRLKSESVLFCKVPGSTGAALDPSGRGRSLYIVDIYGRGTDEEPGTARLLNDYFRSHSAAVPADELGLPPIQIPGNYTLYSPNIQKMGDVQQSESS